MKRRAYWKGGLPKLRMSGTSFCHEGVLPILPALSEDEGERKMGRRRNEEREEARREER